MIRQSALADFRRNDNAAMISKNSKVSKHAEIFVKKENKI